MARNRVAARRIALGLALVAALVGCGQRPQAAQTVEAVFVSMPLRDAVLKLDPVSGEVLATTKVGRLPHHMVVDERTRRLYVVLTGSQAVAEVDVDSGELLRTFLTAPVPMQRADGSAIEGHADGTAQRHTTCFACHSSEVGVKPTIIGNRPFALVFSEDRGSLFVSNTRGASIARIDLRAGMAAPPLAVLPSGPAVEPTALARVGERLYTTVLVPQPDDRAAALRAIDPASGATLSEIPIGARPNFMLADHRRGVLYVANFETNTISEYSLQGEPRRAFTVGAGPQGMALTPDGERLLVANYYDNSLSLVALDRGAVETFPLVLGEERYVNPSHLVPTDDGRGALVVTSGTKGALVRVDLERRAVIGAAPLGPLPFDIVAVHSHGHSKR